MDEPDTIISDIDGTILYHHYDEYHKNEPILLDGVLEIFNDCKRRGGVIILITARSNEHREITENQLKSLNIPYDHLIMEVSHGIRYLLNDRKIWADETAIGVTVDRNKGLSDFFL